MANVKFTELPNASALDGTEITALVQGGVSVQSTTGAMQYAASQYGDFYSAADQTGNTGTPTAVIFGTSVIADKGVTVVTDGSQLTRVTVAEAGDYQITYTLQYANADAADHTVKSWLRLNGTDIVGSAAVRSVPKTGDGGSTSVTQMHIESMTAGQYIQVMWLPQNVNVTLDYTAAAAGPPAVPSIPSAHINVLRVGL